MDCNSHGLRRRRRPPCDNLPRTVYSCSAPRVSRCLSIDGSLSNENDTFRETLDKIGETLRNWLLGQSITMVILGTFVWLGLLIVGVGPALFLGILSGVLAFVPTFGPILPAPQSSLPVYPRDFGAFSSALAIYLAIQTAESYILTPLIQRRAISVPPAILFATKFSLACCLERTVWPWRHQ